MKNSILILMFITTSLQSILSANSYATSEAQHLHSSQAFLPTQTNSIYNPSLSQEVIKTQIEFNSKKLTHINKIFTQKKTAYFELGSVSFDEFCLWHNKVYQLKYLLLFDKYLLKKPNTNPYKNANYLKEKIRLIIEEMEFYKQHIGHFKLLEENGLLVQNNLHLLKYKIIDTYGLFKVTVQQHEQVSSDPLQDYENLLEYFKNSFND